MPSITQSRLVIALVALSLIYIPGSALATHNSVGFDVDLPQADELVREDTDDQDVGDLVPDVPEGHPDATVWHTNLEEPRKSPIDQRGLGYTECTDSTATNYKAKLPNTPGDGFEGNQEDACYVGYLDDQWEWMILGNIAGLSTQGLTAGLSPTHPDGVANPIPSGYGQGYDPLYPVNPKPDDEYCNGEEDTEEVTGVGPVDERYTYATRTVDPSDPVNPQDTQDPINGDEKCGTSQDDSYWPGFSTILAVDVDTLGGSQDIQGTSGGDLVGTRSNSGYLTLPLMLTHYTFLFGQPHPDADHDGDGETWAQEGMDDERLAAGQGPFDPAMNPFVGLPAGTCGDRTEDCVMLTPSDIRHYDTRTPPGVEQLEGDARVCAFAPQFVTVNPSGISGGPCGVFGAPMNNVLMTESAGGFGQEGVPETTWQTTAPGWREGLIFITHAGTTNVADWALDYTEEDPQTVGGIFHYVAVNPKVATEDTLWCSRPNMLTESGTFEVDLNGNGIKGEQIDANGDGDFDDEDDLNEVLPDPGFYRTADRKYVADAVDRDVYTHLLGGPERDVHGATHETVYNAYNDSTSTVLATANDVIDMVPGVSVPPQVNQLVNDTEQRADFQESGEEEPLSQPGAPTYEQFTRTFERGIQCDALGLAQVRGEATDVTGGLRFDASVTTTAPNLKDPTLLQEGLPARENETEWGAWQPNAYTLEGAIHGVLDTNDNDAFDSCAVPNGQPQPSNDFCPWTPLWDAYNEDCRSDGSSCIGLLDARGYDVNDTDAGDDASGVGMYSVLRVTGPTLVKPEAAGATNVTILGDEDTQAQHCVIGISTGFDTYLAEHIGTDLAGDNTFDADDKKALCPDAWDGTGSEDNDPQSEVVVFHDAFDTGGEGSVSSDLQWIKLTPTPDAAPTGGETDEVCLTGIFSVKHQETNLDAGETSDGIADDTEDNLKLSGVNTWTDCDSFDTDAHEPEESE